ncbi:DUF2264 domain-containing protein [Microbacterium sp. ZW T2_14]|uniref:DUF2264 domain-containing protein n=1 Tax=Microbacterium sp. ZW T2_14 TaxID=3378079 RepID=UPI00385246DE
MTYGEPEVATTTGRGRWEALADRLLESVAPYASPSGSLIVLPGPASASGRWSDGLEGFARTGLLAAFRIRGADGDDPAHLIERYARGLAAGTDPSHAERWPTIAERRQAVPEAASVAILLSETRPWLWEQLDPAVQERTVDWLAGVVGTSGYTNNWTWFQTVIETFLQSVGGPWRQDDLDRNTEIQESLYRGDGWYSDGAGPDGSQQNFDHYAGWAWHVYPLFQARILGADLPQVHRERLRAFLDQARDLVGGAGAPLFQGRSLTYRFATLAPFWAGTIAGETPLPTGTTRALADAVLDHFVEGGAIDERGLLSIGWHREFRPLRQAYTGSSSTYWASKGMMGLLLPERHPEWSAAPEAPASTESVRLRSFTAPGWLVVRSEADGIARVLNHGSDGFRGPGGGVRADNPLYHRLGYSTATSPDLSLEGIAEPLESHVALLDAAGSPSHRDRIQRVHLGDRVAVSRSRVHWLDTPATAGAGAATAGAVADVAGWAALRRGPRVTVASVVHGVRELRLAWWNAVASDPQPTAIDDLDAVWPEAEGPWSFRIGGWALPVHDGRWQAPDASTAIRDDGVASAVIGVRGLERQGLTHRTGGDPFGAGSVTPWARGTVPAAEGEVVAALVALGTMSTLDLETPPQIDVAAGRITVRWSDGAVDVVPADGVRA